MFNQLFFAAAIVLFLLSCNNADNAEKKSGDTISTEGHDASHHTLATDVPPLPAINEGAKVFIKNIKDGQEVSSPFKIEMGLEGMKIDTAGPVVAGSGHHHLLIDVKEPSEAGSVVAKDSTHIHFGKGQIETELSLSPGKHTLTLQFADGLHRAYGSQLSSTITVNVKQ